MSTAAAGTTRKLSPQPQPQPKPKPSTTPGPFRAWTDAPSTMAASAPSFAFHTDQSWLERRVLTPEVMALALTALIVAALIWAPLFLFSLAFVATGFVIASEAKRAATASMRSTGNREQ